MSGQTAACRRLYSSMRSGLTWSWKHTRRIRRPPAWSCAVLRDLGGVSWWVCASPEAPAGAGSHPGRHRSVVGSELELVDVRLVEDERVAEQDGVVRADGEVAELAGGELVALLAADVALDQGLARVGGQVAQVLGVPQGEGGHGAVLDVLAHLVRRAETGQRDLALGGAGGEVARGRRDADGGRGDDALEGRVLLQQR